jgi:hypothetical protein
VLQHAVTAIGATMANLTAPASATLLVRPGHGTGVEGGDLVAVASVVMKHCAVNEDSIWRTHRVEMSSAAKRSM